MRRRYALEIYARGLLGRLYGLSGRADEARLLTEQAVFMADQSGAAEALFLWQGQLAALHERAGRSRSISGISKRRRSIERVRAALARGARLSALLRHGIWSSPFCSPLHRLASTAGR